MDVNDLRSVVTVLSLLAFLGIVTWVFSPRRKAQFDDAAAMALRDDVTPGALVDTDLSEATRRSGAV